MLLATPTRLVLLFSSNYFYIQMNRFLQYIIISSVTTLAAYAGQDDVVIAEVAGKRITQTEFYSRAEYTPRPDYCRSDNYIHRKIVLNTLISEKLMAIEAGDDNELTRSPEFYTYITGRKEQAMRQVHFYEKAYKEAEPDSAIVSHYYNYAGRTYNLSYFRVKDSATVSEIYNSIQTETLSFDSAYFSVSLNDSIPQKEITYFSSDHPSVINSLFGNPRYKGEILNPVKVDDSYLLIRIDGWSDRLAVSEKDKVQRWNDVASKLNDERAGELYDVYVGRLMKGKTVEFNFSTFAELVELTGPYYLKDARQKEAMFNKSFWRASNENEVLMDNLGAADLLMDSPLLNYNGEIWTVGRLVEEIKIHPLVFRKNELHKIDFAQQLKLAIVDLIRDKEITKDAYEKGYDKHELVIRNTEMWRSNLLANYQKFRVINSQQVEGKSKEQILESVLNPYVRSLQIKYSEKIKINISEFDSMKLSSIDMLALQTDMAFPFIVPLFPELTTLHRLDYGSAIK